MKKTTTIYQDAIRILFLLVNGSEPYTDDADSEIKGLFKGEVKLHAMDFWMRYPDYFANELLLKYEETGNNKFLELAKNIFTNNEPDLRRIPMIRHLFGAYQDLNNTLAVLVSKGLIKYSGTKSKAGNKVQQHDYLLFDKAYQIISTAANDFPILKWYDDRSKLVVEIVENRGGTALKDRQYEHIEYAKTRQGGIIPSIKEDVLEKIENLTLVNVK